MSNRRDVLYQRIRSLTLAEFEALALDIFLYQAEQNPTYKKFLDLVKVDPLKVKDLEAIPCLPIQFFKQQIIKTGQWKEERLFKSSGTTGDVKSQHALRSLDLYHAISRMAFEQSYGILEDYSFFCLLPGYIERNDASLVEMANFFISNSNYDQSGFYLNQFEDLLHQISNNQSAGIPTILLGVTFALLELAEKYAPDLNNIVIMETGGMKGQREEWTKERLHKFLKSKFNVNQIHSEYGMTELTSQCYAQKKGIFQESPTMKIRVREVTDPFQECRIGKVGVINIFDLGNLDTCSFIETQDLGRRLSEATFELQGRLDFSDIRGCNLLVL